MSNSNTLVKIGKRVKAFDFFGESVGFSVLDGESSHKSWLGALVSLAVTVITVAFAVRQYRTMYNYGNTTHQSIVSNEALYTKDNPLTYADSGFDVAFNLVYVDYADGRKMKVVDTAGYIEMHVKTQKWENWGFDVEILPTHKCTQDDRSRFKEASRTNNLDFFSGFGFLWDEMLCVDNYEEFAFMHGDLESNIGQGVNIEVVRCQGGAANNCKSDEEYDKFMETPMALVMAHS